MDQRTHFPGHCAKQERKKQHACTHACSHAQAETCTLLMSRNHVVVHLSERHPELMQLGIFHASFSSTSKCGSCPDCWVYDCLTVHCLLPFAIARRCPVYDCLTARCLLPFAISVQRRRANRTTQPALMCDDSWYMQFFASKTTGKW